MIKDVPLEPEIPFESAESAEPWTHPRDREILDTVAVPVKQVVTSAGTQPRVALDPDTVDEYTESIKSAIAAGRDNPMPAGDAFRDSTGKIILADGFHRIAAHTAAGESEMLLNIREGTDRDAVLFSCGANGTHGLRRTQKDKQRAVKTVLADSEWAQWSNTKIAELCDVSETMVRSLRKPTDTPAETRKATRAGKTIEIKTGNIGKGGGKSEKPASDKAAASDKKSSKSAAKSTPEEDKEDDKRLAKVAAAVGKKFGEPEAKKFTEGYTSGALQLSVKDMREIAAETPARIAVIYPLVTEKQWKPSRALAFIDRDLSEASKIEDLLNHAVARSGEITVKIGGFTVSAIKAGAKKKEAAVK